jgi:hypothetical protein
MKEAKILISTLPLIYVALAYVLWMQDAKVMSCILITLSVLFGCLVIGIIVNSERK